MDRPELTIQRWRKSLRSAEQGSCVELTAGAGAVLVRDSKDPGGPRLAFGATTWRVFVGRIKNDRT